METAINAVLHTSALGVLVILLAMLLLAGMASPVLMLPAIIRTVAFGCEGTLQAFTQHG